MCERLDILTRIIWLWLLVCLSYYHEPEFKVKLLAFGFWRHEIDYYYLFFQVPDKQLFDVLFNGGVEKCIALGRLLRLDEEHVKIYEKVL